MVTGNTKQIKSDTGRKQVFIFSTLVIWITLAAGILLVQIPSVYAQYPSERVEASVVKLRELAREVKAREGYCLIALSSRKLESCGATYTCLGKTSIYDFLELTDVAQRLESKAVEAESHLPELRRIEKEIYKNQTAIIRLGFKKNVAEIDEWTNLVAADRISLIKKTVLAVLDAAFIAAGNANDISANSEKFAELIQELKTPVVSKALLRVGVSAEELVEYFVRINGVQNTRLRAQLIELALNKLGIIKDAWVVAADNSSDGEKLLSILKGTLGLFLKNSPLQILLVEIELTTQYVYSAILGNTAKAGIAELTKLNEENLKSLKTLNNLLTKNVQDLNKELGRLPSPCL
jgi:hypothetical protein